MSTTGGAPFFTAPEPERDGTLQGSVTGERFADPLSGLVTAADAAPATTPDEALPTARPVQHDPEAVKRMVEAALKEEAAQTPKEIPPLSGDRPDNVPLGLLPRQRTWPTRAPQLLKKVPRPRPKAKTEIADDDIEAELAERQARGRRLPTIGMPNLGRPSTSTAGVLLAVVLLIVFAVVALLMLSSLVSSVSGLFG
ncbi:hypothetical protein [Amycolatopsis sp. FDAARGOS 1241]|uniref:hypothetical protein n=1 Tax=Amycolatopsis sp. FDAARGOS 1241 TaxID=2778070 RepID=UPI001EF372C1|nr:hypothetical protein [Amycolatopsis sp. FDAARGOS 1241]